MSKQTSKLVAHLGGSSFLVTHLCVCWWNLLPGLNILCVEEGHRGQGLYTPILSCVVWFSRTVAVHQCFGNFPQWKFLLCAQAADPPTVSWFYVLRFCLIYKSLILDWFWHQGVGHLLSSNYLCVLVDYLWVACMCLLLYSAMLNILKLLYF